VTSKPLRLPVVELDLVADGQKVAHDVSPRGLVATSLWHYVSHILFTSSKA
jgi:hypothetical protein